MDPNSLQSTSINVIIYKDYVTNILKYFLEKLHNIIIINHSSLNKCIP